MPTRVRSLPTGQDGMPPTSLGWTEHYDFVEPTRPCESCSEADLPSVIFPQLRMGPRPASSRAPVYSRCYIGMAIWCSNAGLRRPGTGGRPLKGPRNDAGMMPPPMTEALPENVTPQSFLEKILGTDGISVFFSSEWW